MNQPRNVILQRAFRLIRLLDGRRYMPSDRELTEALGVHRRTLYRYLDAMEAEGYVLPRRLHDDSRRAA